MRFLLLKISSGWNLIQPGVKISNESSIYPPLGLEYIAASLEKEGHTAEIIDLGIENISKEHMKNSVLNSDAVGISVDIDNYSTVAKTTESISKIDPDVTQVLGGSNCSFIKEKTLEDMPLAKICCIGEGEQTIIDIVKYLQGKKELSNINGIYYRENNNIKTGRPPKFIDNLDSLPFPARHLVEKNEYGKFLNNYTWKRKFTTMISSRGCPHNCRFCTRFNMGIKGYTHRRRSAENIIKEIEELNGKYRSIMFVDDNFLSDAKRAHKICDMLIERNNNIDLLVMGTRVNTAERELFKKMKKAGFIYLNFGVESGNQDVLDFYNKGITLEQIRKAVNLGNEMGFITVGTFILGAPIETKEHFENTIKFACSLPFDSAFFAVLEYQMGSDLWIEAVNNNLISKDEIAVVADLRRGLGNFTAEELGKYVNTAYRRFYMRPTYILNSFYKAFKRKDYKIIKKTLLWGTTISKTALNK